MRDKKIDPDVDVNVVARGTPGMSGADLANLVNEAALFAVRREAHEVHREDFDAARDRVLMGLKRESLALSEEEKEIIAYHEGGHAVCAYVLEHADPLHKVTILPTGMALGVTHQLPIEERHIYKREYIADSLVVRLGGRVAEELDLRPPVHRRAERPRRQHRARAQDGARVGHVRSHRSDGVGFAGRGVPRRGPHAHTRLLRRDRPCHRRRGRADPARRRGPLPQGAHRVPGRPRRRRQGAARAGDARAARRSPTSSTRRWAARSADRA